MKFLKNKKFFIVSTICYILLVILNIVVTLKEYRDINNEIEENYIKIISVIKKEYPEVKEEKIIKILNDESDNLNNGEIKETEELLKKYGINENIINVLDNKKYSSIKYNVLILTLGFIIYILINCIYRKMENKTIGEITEYIKKINEKCYELKIEENTENELSKLKNELYKITVMLKEEAETQSNAKKNIKTALEDISHQLKTPLTSISIMLDNIIETKDMDEETRNVFICEIDRQIKWINWLILSLLKLARIDSNSIEFEKEKINVGTLVNSVIKDLEIPIDIKEQNVIINGDNTVSFMGDFNWEKEALINIIKNCIEHSEQNKKIYINYEENNFYTKIEIKDEGKGISKEDLKHIFERFYKGKNSSENSIGIGLALAKTIIEKDNGKITCTSEINKGTKFEIKYVKNI